MSKSYKTEEIINSLDGLKRAEPSPFLFTRIQAKMIREEESTSMSFLRLITKPAFAMGIAILLVGINGYLIYGDSSNDISAADFSQPLAAEYVQHTSNPYENGELP